MNLKTSLALIAVLGLGGFAAYKMLHTHPHTAGAEEHGHTHGPGAEEHEEPVVKGPHRGRVLVDGDFALELAIFETGVPPEFRAWVTNGGNPVAPADVKLSVTLIRPGKVKDPFTFATTGDFLRGDHEVCEPHSFDYEITAVYRGKTHRWAFSSPEMQTTIASDAATRAGILVEKAGPAEMSDLLEVYGRIKVNANMVARVTPRFAGLLSDVRKGVGERVTAGEIMARVETNQTLSNVEVKAPISGVVVEREATSGETVAEGAALFTLADLGEVWVDLDIPKSAGAKVKAGQKVTVIAEDGGEDASGTIAEILPVTSAETQTFTARVALANPEGRWRPGTLIKGRVTLATSQVPVAVKASGIQTLFAFTVVFSRHDDLYQARPLELGRQSDGYVEVLKGIKAGEEYVTENSFLIKADIGKSGATHDH